MLAAYLAAVGVLALLAIVPGPDVAVVTRYSLTSGRRAGINASVGVVIGLLVWGTLTVLGLAAVLAASSSAYTIVKVAGATYLVWLGRVLSVTWLTGYAVVFSRSRSILDKPRMRQLIDAVTGLVLIGFGVHVAIETR